MRPEAYACDLHPDYLSTRFAEESGAPVLRFQHHAAHVAAIGAEHGACDALFGAALDGHGLGQENRKRRRQLGRRSLAARRPRRILARGAMLRPWPCSGGDRAAREPLRMGLAAFAALGRLDEAAGFFAAHREAAELARIFAARPAPMTTSLGRLFDAASALLGFARGQDFEGQAAMRLEALVKRAARAGKRFRCCATALSISRRCSRISSTKSPVAREGAELLHGTLIAGLGAWLAALARPGERIALGGGCMMNKVLAEGLAAHLRDKRLCAAAGAKNSAQ